MFTSCLFADVDERVRGGVIKFLMQSRHTLMLLSAEIKRNVLWGYLIFQYGAKRNWVVV
jgi:hypothetical protein